MDQEFAIRVQNVTKLYKLYNRPYERLTDSLGLSRRKKFKEHYALHDLSFDIMKGESIGIIGTNGAGKSTILKIITGVLSPTEGDVLINGRISALLELGAGFNMEYTGLENVYLNGMMIGFTREEVDEKLDSILAFADIGEFIHQPVKTYSSGMFVRLAFAVAINIEPEILIVDEALSVGDVFFQAKCYKKFEEFKAMGKTILFVSHDLGSISKYCDRVILLDHGRKMDEGTPKEMVGLYKRLLATRKKQQAEGGDGVSTGSVGATSKDQQVKKDVASGLWKDSYAANPNVDEYGDGSAHIIDFAIVDEEGNVTDTLDKGASFSIKSKVLFDTRIENPIFTYTFKDAHGTAITGTNSMYERVNVGTVEAGETYVATFSQVMNLQGGEYLLSISCTGFEAGEFRVYHRLYDVCSITVISEQDTVGYYDMFSKVTVEKA